MRSCLMFVVAAVTFSANASAQYYDLEVSLPSAARDYCHVIRFPQGWSTRHFDKSAPQQLFFGAGSSDYEFRISGVLSTKFLVGAFTDFVGTKYYANNRYQVDLAHPAAPITVAGLKLREDAAVAPFYRRSAFPPGTTVPNDKLLDFRGFQYNRTGKFWGQPSGDATRLSPDQAWLVLQSTSPGAKASSEKVLLDFFNADTGQKLFTIEGTFSNTRGLQADADEALAYTGWVTERYFIVPLGTRIDRFLDCDFGHKP